MVLIKKLFLWITVMIFEFYEQKYVEKVYLKLNLAQSAKQESPQFVALTNLVQ